MISQGTQPIAKREARRSTRRQMITAIARTVFLKKGFAATSMSEIAHLLGGSKGTLWSYFPSKEALFGAVIREVSDEVSKSLEECLRPHHDLDRTLHAFAHRFAEQLDSPTMISLLRVVAAELERFPDLGRILFIDGVSRIAKRLSRYFQEEMAAHRMRDDDPDEAARQFFSLLKQPVHVRIFYGDTPDLLSHRIDVDAAVRMFLRAYKLQATPAGG